jgi:RND family efflux transporter MFP subunit
MRIADTSGLTERSFPGRARAGQEVNRSFRVSGPLITLPVSVGDEVKAGDILARIDPKDFETRLATLEGQLEREQAKAKRAQADLTRLQNIFKEDPGATSQTAIDRALQARDSAKAGVRSLEASVQNARDQLSYTELKAPFDGIVVETYVENFETVVTKQPILRVLDPSSIEFVIYVPESLIRLAPYVTSSSVTFDALPGISVPAKIKEIGKEASQATRTYPVTLVMEQPEGAEILPGMAGQASIASRPPEDSALIGIQVPATAVFTGEDRSKSFVWIVDE